VVRVDVFNGRGGWKKVSCNEQSDRIDPERRIEKVVVAMEATEEAWDSISVGIRGGIQSQSQSARHRPPEEKGIENRNGLTGTKFFVH